VWSESNRDNLSVVAAALFAIFPALSALISLYGLTADPATVEREFGMLGSVLCAGGGGEMQVPRRGRNAADAPRP